MPLPETIQDVAQLDDLLSEPADAVADALGMLDGDLMILGVGGKIGPSLARMAKRAYDAAGIKRKIYGVERAFQGDLEAQLRNIGIETISGDLLDETNLNALPDVPNIIYMAGMKFGATGNEALTWALNTFLPGVVCRRFPQSRIVAFSTGNVYGLVPIDSGGSVETDTPNPDGEYAQSCLGRERIFQHFAKAGGTPVTVFRLNYAVEMRYGVLIDLAQQVHAGQTIDVTMGYFNVTWQGDANAAALQALTVAASPACIVNVMGPERLGVRDVCTCFGQLMNKPVSFTGAEAPDALLGNGAKGHKLFGKHRVASEQMMRWIADWVQRGGEMLGKPTHFEVRDGKF